MKSAARHLDSYQVTVFTEILQLNVFRLSPPIWTLNLSYLLP